MEDLPATAFEEEKKVRTLSGIQPSGSPHLGNYFGAVEQFVASQDAGEDPFIFVADWHSLTSVENPEDLRNNVRELVALYLASGLDPEKVTLYRQSDLKEIQELSWLLATTMNSSTLLLGHSYKDKIAKGEVANAGLLYYPVLMAADILAVQADVVPVGKDQKQHLEITRDVAQKFNKKFGKEVFKIPEERTPKEVALVPGTDANKRGEDGERSGAKMSKSQGNTIELFAPDGKLKKQVNSIVTAPVELGTPMDWENCVIFDLFKLMTKDENELALLQAIYEKGEGFGKAKGMLLEKIHQVFDPIRARFAEIIKDEAYLAQVLAQGKEKAQPIIAKTLASAREAVGLD